MSNGNSSSNKGTGYNRAVERAVTGGAGGETTTLATTDVGSMDMAPMPKGIEGMLSKPSKEEIASMMSDETMEFAPQIVSLEEGDRIVGFLEGYGRGTEFAQKNPATGAEEIRHVNTWIFRHPGGGLRASILSSMQLDEKLPPFIGSEGQVTVYRGKDIKTRSGFKVANYTVSGPKLRDGTVRTWARQRPPQAVIEAQSREVSQIAQVSSQGTGGEAREDAQA